MMGGIEFLDELVIHMAKDLRSTLVSLDVQDLEDLGSDFYLQEQKAVPDVLTRSPTSGSAEIGIPIPIRADRTLQDYFAVPSEEKSDAQQFRRCMEAYNVIFDAVKHKQQNYRSSPKAMDGFDSVADSTGGEVTSVLVYVRDGAWTGFHYESEYHYEDRRRLFRRLTDAINHRRRNGENITIIFALAHSDFDDLKGTADTERPWKFAKCGCWMCDDPCPDLDQCVCDNCNWSFFTWKLGLKRLYIHPVMPVCLPRDWPAASAAACQERVAKKSMRHFKRKLRLHLIRYTPSPANLLDVDCDWFSLFPKSLFALFSSDLSVTDAANAPDRPSGPINVATARIVGRCVRSGQLDEEVIGSVLSAMLHAREPQASAETEESGEEDAQATVGIEENEEDANSIHSISDYAISWDHMMFHLREACDSYEEDLLAGVVDPSKHLAFGTFQYAAYTNRANRLDKLEFPKHCPRK